MAGFGEGGFGRRDNSSSRTKTGLSWGDLGGATSVAFSGSSLGKKRDKVFFGRFTGDMREVVFLTALLTREGLSLDCEVAPRMG
jgi:hypothetical protein